jgi:DNA repair photolyase
MSEIQSTRITGTKEWSAHSVNVILGCPHRCRYCYARSRAVDYGQCPSHEAWGTTYHRVRDAEVAKRRKVLNGRVMFPTTHDITPEHRDSCITVLENLLSAGNDVLIVSKPHFDCVKELCHRLLQWRSQVTFRFTIGADDDEILSYWEPGAPSFSERLESLAYAFYRRWSTSVSCEPLLDARNVGRLFRTLEQYVTDTIWIGKMNDVRRRVMPGTDRAEVARIEAGQTDATIRRIYERLKDEPKVRWKESYKAVLGLELPATAGLDV